MLFNYPAPKLWRLGAGSSKSRVPIGGGLCGKEQLVNCQLQDLTLMKLLTPRRSQPENVSHRYKCTGKNMPFPMMKKHCIKILTCLC